MSQSSQNSSIKYKQCDYLDKSCYEISYELSDVLHKKISNLKYFHCINEDEGCDYFNLSVDNLIYKKGDIINIDEKTNEITLTKPIILQTFTISIDSCPLCNKFIEITNIDLYKPFKLEYCKYYTNASKKIQNMWKRYKSIT